MHQEVEDFQAAVESVANACQEFGAHDPHGLRGRWIPISPAKRGKIVNSPLFGCHQDVDSSLSLSLCLSLSLSLSSVSLSLSLSLSLSIFIYIYIYIHTYIYIYIYICIWPQYVSEVGGGSLAHPTGKSFRFVRACVRAVLVKSFRNEKVDGVPCIFYLCPREVVSCIFCDFGFFVNSH